jgi:hypothetical protein
MKLASKNLCSVFSEQKKPRLSTIFQNNKKEIDFPIQTTKHLLLQSSWFAIKSFICDKKQTNKHSEVAREFRVTKIKQTFRGGKRV